MNELNYLKILNQKSLCELITDYLEAKFAITEIANIIGTSNFQNLYSCSKQIEDELNHRLSISFYLNEFENSSFEKHEN